MIINNGYKMLADFKVFVDKLKANNSRLYKESVLREYQNDEMIKELVKFIFNPYIVTGMSKKKFYKQVLWSPTAHFYDILSLMKYLQLNNHGSDRDIANIQTFVRDNKEYEDIIHAIVCKDLTVGVTATTINKIWGKGFIPTFDVMLAEKYFDDPVKYLPEGTQFILTEKLDGVRCVLLFDEKKEPHFFSRNGKEIMDLVDLAKEAKQLDPNYVYDGELLANTVGHSKDVYRDTMSIVGSDNVKTGVLYNVFDKIPREDFKAGYCKVTSLNRKQALEAEITCDKFKYIRNVPMLYVGDNQERIHEYLKWAKDNGKEGVMINWVDGPYECKRSRKLLKVKSFNETEAYVKELVEGTGRNAGRLGAIIIQFKDKDGRYHECNCGSGFSDKERDLYWAQPELIKDKVVEVSYFEVSNNQTDDSLSLRFPTWLGRIREDKSFEEMNTI